MALEGFGVCKTCTATVRRRVPSAGWINYEYRMKIHLLVYGVTQNESWSASSTGVCWMERGGRWADPSNLPAFEGMKPVAQNLENSVNDAMVQNACPRHGGITKALICNGQSSFSYPMTSMSSSS